MKVYSKYGGKINKVSSKHASSSFRSALFSGINPFSSIKSKKRGDSMFVTFSKRGKLSL